MDAVDAYLKIKGRSLLSLFSFEDLRPLLAEAVLVELRQGELPERSNRPDEIWIVIDGEISLHKEKGPLSVPFGRVSSGRSLELKAVFSDEVQWQFFWIAEGSCRLLRLSFSSFKLLLEKFPLVGEYLRRVTLHREIQKLKNDLRLLGFQQSEIQNTVVRLSRLSVSTVELKNLSIPFLVSLAEGDLRLVWESEEFGRKILASISALDYFILNGDPSVFLETSTVAEVWVLSKQDWEKIANPKTVASFFQVSDPSVRKIEAFKVGRPVWQVVPSIEVDDDTFTIDVKDFQCTPEELAAFAQKKPVFIGQHDEMDCGAACLAMISKFYGKKISVSDFRSLIHITREGASVLSVKKAAERKGFQAIGVYAPPNALVGLRVPLIALMEYHYVVVYRVDAHSIFVGDPAIGLREIPLEEFSKEYSDNALLLKPEKSFFEGSDSSSTLGKYVELLIGSGRQVFEIAFASLLAFGVGLVIPLFTQAVFDNIFMDQKKGLLNALVIVATAAFILSHFLAWVRNYLFAHLAAQLDGKFSALFMRHTFGLPLSYFAVRRVGDFTTRIQELRRIREFFTGQTLGLALGVLSMVIYCAVVGLYSWRIPLLVLGLVALQVGWLAFVTPRLTNLYQHLFKAMGRQQSFAYEQIQGIETLKALRATIAARWRWEDRYLETIRLKKRLRIFSALSFSISEFFKEFIQVACLLVSVWLFLKGEFTLGQVVAMTTLISNIVQPVEGLVQAWGQFNQISVSLGRVDDIITSATEDDPATPLALATEGAGRIQFDSVHFQYGNELSPLVVNNVSLDIRAGETVAFVGRSGSGKTTLAYMIGLLYRPTRGRVLLDGVDISQVSLSELRKRVGLVIQENTVFSGNLIDNIALGDAHPSFSKVIDAAKAAEAHGFIERLPQGYLTVLGEGGQSLSAGQRQRINIARALYKDPSFLVLDEATSALDAITEQKIIASIKAMARKKTIIIIAHRLNTVAQADRIAVFDQARVVEVGSHEELLSAQGQYYQLVRNQIAL